MASLTFEGETHGEIVQKVRRWLASVEGVDEAHLSPTEAIEQGAEITKEALRIIASAAPEPIAHSDVVRGLTAAGYKATDSVKQTLIDGLASIGEVSGGGILKTARDARKHVVYEMNVQVARQILKALRPR
jgi:hypothetical protein